MSLAAIKDQIKGNHKKIVESVFEKNLLDIQDNHIYIVYIKESGQ